MIPEHLFVDGAVLAIRCRHGSDLVHCATLNVGSPFGPRTYSVGSRCGVGYNGVRAIGEWHTLNPEWRRCPKCVKAEDARMLEWIEWGGQRPPQKPITINPKWLRD